MYALGDRNVYLSVTYWNGQPRVHIRKHDKKNTGDLLPQKKGICLSALEWSKMKEFIHNVDAEVARLQAQPPMGSSEGNMRMTDSRP